MATWFFILIQVVKKLGECQGSQALNSIAFIFSVCHDYPSIFGKPI